jgi:hypothetical protein
MLRRETGAYQREKVGKSAAYLCKTGRVRLADYEEDKPEGDEAGAAAQQ